MNKSKNDIAWEKLFEEHKILEKVAKFDFFEISSTAINKHREARLMTKFDHKSQLPRLFFDNSLSILPTSRGGYVIGKFQTFHNFNTDDVDVTPIEFPTFLESLDYRDITSEATAINCAFVSKIIHDFTDEYDLYPTVSGRMSSAEFNFKINSLNGLIDIAVGNSQVEIDGGFEGNTSLNLIEAKNYISDDFLVRQLFYPYKLWNEKISKVVRPIYLTYTNGIFHLREYKFQDDEHYNSLKLVKHRKYVVYESRLNIEILSELIDSTPIVREPEIPFPQADSFDRVVNLCELLNQRGYLLKEEVTQNYDFDSRQTDYYCNAGRYLGIIDIVNDETTRLKRIILTTTGKNLFSKNLIDRQKEFIKLIISHSAFKKSLKLHLANGEMPNKDSIVEIMKTLNLYRVESDVTYYRRASTVIGWINWIINQLEE